MLVFEEREKPEKPEKNLSPHMALTLGFEPGPHWWEESALTIASSLA